MLFEKKNYLNTKFRVLQTNFFINLEIFLSCVAATVLKKGNFLSYQLLNGPYIWKPMLSPHPSYSNVEMTYAPTLTSSRKFNLNKGIKSFILKEIPLFCHITRQLPFLLVGTSYSRTFSPYKNSTDLSLAELRIGHSFTFYSAKDKPLVALFYFVFLFTSPCNFIIKRGNWEGNP